MSEVERLRSENAALRHRVIELERALYEDFVPPTEMKLTRRELQVLQLLMKRERVTKESLIAVIFDGADVGSNTLESHVSKLRTKLRPYGVTVSSKRYVGYWITPAETLRLREVMQGRGVAA